MHKFLEFVRQQDQEQQEHNALLARKGGGGGSIEQYHSIIRPAAEKQHLIADLAHVKCVADTNGGLVSLFANEATIRNGGDNVTCSDAMAVTFHTSSQIKHGLFLGKDVFCF